SNTGSTVVKGAEREEYIFALARVQRPPQSVDDCFCLLPGFDRHGKGDLVHQVGGERFVAVLLEPVRDQLSEAFPVEKVVDGLQRPKVSGFVRAYQNRNACHVVALKVEVENLSLLQNVSGRAVTRQQRV